MTITPLQAGTPAIICTFALYSASVHSQDDGASIRVGETQLTPSLRLGYNSETNVYQTADNEEDATSFTVSPQVLWVADKGRVRFAARYNGDYEDSSESAFDIANHRLGLEAMAEMTSKQRIDASLNTSIVNQDLRTGISRRLTGEVDELVKYRQSRLGLQYTYGAAGAAGNVQLGLNFQTLDYLNQESITDGFDEQVVAPYIGFSYRIGGGTRLLLRIQQASYDFESPRSDRTDTTALVGLTMSPSSALSGRVAIGNTQTELDFGETANDSTIALEADLVYRPNSFSRFAFSFDRELDGSSSGLGNSVDPVTITDIASLSWRNNWNSRFYTDVILEREVEDYECPTSSSTEDSVRLVAGYSFRRWMIVGIDAKATTDKEDRCANDSDPTLPAADIETSTVGIFTRFTL